MSPKKPAPGIVSTLKFVGLPRLIACSVFALIGVPAVAILSISGVARSKAPQTALVLMPNESVALANEADRIFFDNPSKPSPQARTLALKALDSQPINPKALRVLGYIEDVNGRPEAAKNLIMMSAKLSRRESGAQLWLIEASVNKEDIQQALLHYDIVLRTKPDFQSLLFPRLLKAIEAKEIRSALKPYIRADNGWAGGFLFYANENSTNLPALVDLILESGGLKNKASASSQEIGLLNRLVAAGNFVEAKRIFLNMEDSDATRLTSAAFQVSDKNARHGPLGWKLIDDPDAGGGFSDKAGENQTRLFVYANAATTSPVAAKLLYLRPGTYSFSVELSAFTRGDDGFLRWQVYCAQNPSVPVWSLESVALTAQARITVPERCNVQTLELTASGGKGQTGLEATIEEVSMTPQA